MGTYIPQGADGAANTATVVQVAGTAGANIHILKTNAAGELQVGLNTGTNNIGDVDVLTQPARVATTDSITAKVATDAIQNGLTALTPKFKAFGVASSGTNDLLAAVSSKKIRVLSFFCIVSAATNIYFLDDTPTTLLGDSTNKIQLAANSGFVLPFSPTGWFETGTTKKVQVNLSAANVLSGGFTYIEV